MTQIDERPATTAAETAERWLAAFNGALEKGDTAAVSELFLETSFWRDLVAFTWNITTIEKAAARSRTCWPRRWQTWRRPARLVITAEEPAEADGIIEAWIELRDRGRPRPRPAAAARRPGWTLLTTLDELKGHEEPAGRAARRAPSTARSPDRETWLERTRPGAEAASWATTSSRTW